MSNSAGRKGSSRDKFLCLSRGKLFPSWRNFFLSGRDFPSPSNCQLGAIKEDADERCIVSS